jgi:hypothetical protein
MRNKSAQVSLDHGFKVEAGSLAPLHCRPTETDNRFGKAETITPVILGGGSGTRLWPLSREMQPKQFVQLNDDGSSLFGATLRRLVGMNFASPLIMCNNKHRFLVRDEVKRVEAIPRAIILEPISRNT